MKRTGSSGSRVPPALTTTRTPCEVAPGRRGRARSSTRADDHARIGQPALARVAAGQPARSRAGRSRRRAAPGWPGSRAPTACSHISVCMAGQTMHRGPGGQQGGAAGGRRRARRRSGRGCAPSPARPRPDRPAGRAACAGWARPRPTATAAPARTPARRRSPRRRSAWRPRSAPGVTCTPASTSRRQTSTAL